MPEYVYALHDFSPEHEDEVTFRAGERIEIVEKDDLYQDGWWQGKNLAGKVGLFPQSYTTPAPPDLSFTSSSSSTTVGDSSPDPSSQTDKSTLQPLEEVSEPGTPPPPKDNSATTIVAPVPTSPAVILNGSIADEGLTHRRTVSGGEEVMRATLTDVQKAIEQLGQGRGMHEDADDGTRSFSFASTKDGADTETDTEYDMSDVDGGDAQPETDHKDRRMKLAEKARRAIQEAEKLEAMIGTNRTTAPPIEVDISDESEGEDDHQDFTSRASAFARSHPHIPEEDEDGDPDTNGKKVNDSNRFSDGLVSRAPLTPPTSQFAERLSSTPEADDHDPKTAGPARETFGFPLSPSKIATFENVVGRQSSPVVSISKPGSPVPRIDTSSLSFSPPPRSETPKRESLKLVPHSPVPLANGTHTSNDIKALVPARSPSPLALTPQSQLPSAVTSSTLHAAGSEKGGRDKTHPSEWSVDQVVEWLKGRGFDQDVCDKFIEQEISGDVLLELDANLLKSEIGIMAFGKRVRIANAISDLKRPPSITYSDRAEQSPSSPNIQNLPQTHTRTQSQSQSHHSFPGANGHNYSQSPHSPLGSPLGQGANSPGHSAGLGGQYIIVGADSPSRPPPLVGLGLAPGSAEGSATSTTGTLNDSNKVLKARPSQLSLSPSDGALSATAKAIVDIPEAMVRERAKVDDRGHMSESEVIPATSIRRRLFGRSHDSSLSKSGDRDSKAESTKSEGFKTGSQEASSPPAATADKEKEKETSGRTARPKKSMDGHSRSDRLSIFGGTFGPSLGKSRKPPPRYSSDDPTEKSSMFGLPRLHASASTRRTSNSSGRPETPTQTSPQDGKDKSRESLRDSKDKEQHALLRKRTSSAISGGDVVKANGGIISPLKPGMSVLEQIGQPDHNGWMRKKGDRYNNWKLRYFVLKGPHLYCLRSNSRTETRIKGYIHVAGYKVTVDETLDPGRYGFRIDHDQDKSHYFSSDEKSIVRDWMKAIMKATIGRDYTKPVISSCNIPTIPLMVAQAMNPAPRPPSPTARDATQKALRRENPNQLSSRDARVLMGLPSNGDAKDDRARLDSFFGEPPKVIESPAGPAPPRPSREMRRLSSQRTSTIGTIEDNLIEWANSHLPEAHQISDSSGSLCGGLALLRLAEAIKGKPSSPPVLDSAFPTDPTDEKLDGLFRLFDFLLDNDVKMGSVSINDVRQGKRDKIIQLLKALKTWEDKRRAIVQTIGAGAGYQAGGFIAPMTWA
ncbi:hypothetical protein BDN72DRAFT_614262 [Pluteus cervinus]|uniref:Uncharacterized protein n=1 Tax=Pluteus cervinus TaxID=181527 RepID=A0ACD3AWS3_9AGAR|nr:hypothetical protein BDN72DRAFT_614262 [Pluteus cervinus]